MKTTARCAQTVALLTAFVPFAGSTALAAGAGAPTETPPAADSAGQPGGGPHRRRQPCWWCRCRCSRTPPSPRQRRRGKPPRLGARSRRPPSRRSRRPRSPRSACSGCPDRLTRSRRRAASSTARSGSPSTACSGRTCRPRRGRDRFVIGLSGWGWLDTAYVKFGPWGQNPNAHQPGPAGLLRSSRGACCCGSRRPTRSPTGSSRGRSSSSGPRIRRSQGSGGRWRRHGRSLAAHRAVEPVGLSGRPLRGVGGLSPRAWASTRTPSSARAPSARRCSGTPFTA